ncbi:MAG TPA: hypothetical protein VGS27_29285 [Candidatus Sulfotelmatobacter sp.]|nr:hypothetical protein [Candidatus Sulfotelmatobacter sp.]
MDTSELLKTPLSTTFLLALTLTLAFLAAHRIGNRWLRIPVRITCSIGAVVTGLLLAFMLFARGKPNETITELKNGPFKVLIRSQEFHHSGTINVDVCVTDSPNRAFPKNEKLQCFLHGYDFSALSVKWLSDQNIEIAFDCGRVTNFTNSATVYPNGPVPVAFYATLRDTCMKQVP